MTTTPKPEQTSADLADAVAPFVRFRQVAEVAAEVIDEHLSLRELLDLNVEYLLKTEKPKNEDPAIDDLCRAIIVGEPWHSLTGLDVVVWVSGEHWRLLGADYQRGMLTHALSHVLVTEKGQIKKVGHDVDAFTREVKRFGSWTARLQSFFRALGQEAPGEQRSLEEIAEAARDLGITHVERREDGTTEVVVDLDKKRGASRPRGRQK